jgi:hypothetical protein
MPSPTFEIHEDDKERLKDLESETIDSCVSFGFDPIIGRGIREAYRVGYERAARASALSVENAQLKATIAESLRNSLPKGGQ